MDEITKFEYRVIKTNNKNIHILYGFLTQIQNATVSPRKKITTLYLPANNGGQDGNCGGRV